MKKIKRTSATTTKATNIMGSFDFTHKGFAIAHAEKTIYVLESTDAEIRKGNEAVVNKAMEILDKHPTYCFAILHVMFLA